MPDPNDTTPRDGEEPFEPQRLLQDLKAMPRISAPMDFSYHLAEALAQPASKPAPSWWKRLFLPQVEGGIRIPGVAYGAVGIMVVLFFSVYVFRVTDFERDLRKETRPGANTEETAPVQESAPVEHAPTVPETGGDVNTEDGIRPQKLGDQNPIAAPSTSEPPAPRAVEQPRTRTDAVPTAPPSAPQGVAGEDDLELNIRGFLETEKKSTLDSALQDSLRSLDSLRRLKLGTPQSPPQNPR